MTNTLAYISLILAGLESEPEIFYLLRSFSIALPLSYSGSQHYSLLTTAVKRFISSTLESEDTSQQ
jgi:hypothetical protein